MMTDIFEAIKQQPWTYYMEYNCGTMEIGEKIITVDHLDYDMSKTIIYYNNTYQPSQHLVSESLDNTIQQWLDSNNINNWFDITTEYQMSTNEMEMHIRLYADIPSQLVDEYYQAVIMYKLMS